MSDLYPGRALFSYHQGGWEFCPSSNDQFLAPSGVSVYPPLLPVVSGKRVVLTGRMCKGSYGEISFRC